MVWLRFLRQLPSLSNCFPWHPLQGEWQRSQHRRLSTLVVFSPILQCWRLCFPPLWPGLSPSLAPVRAGLLCLLTSCLRVVRSCGFSLVVSSQGRLSGLPSLPAYQVRAPGLCSWRGRPGFLLCLHVQTMPSSFLPSFGPALPCRY